MQHLGDAPYVLHAAINTGLRILGYEEYPPDERPARRIWMDAEGLAAHWKRVERERERKYGPEPAGEVVENGLELVHRG